MIFPLNVHLRNCGRSKRSSILVAKAAHARPNGVLYHLQRVVLSTIRRWWTPRAPDLWAWRVTSVVRIHLLYHSGVQGVADRGRESSYVVCAKAEDDILCVWWTPEGTLLTKEKWAVGERYAQRWYVRDPTRRSGKRIPQEVVVSVKIESSSECAPAIRDARQVWRRRWRCASRGGDYTGCGVKGDESGREVRAEAVVVVVDERTRPDSHSTPATAPARLDSQKCNTCTGSHHPRRLEN